LQNIKYWIDSSQRIVIESKEEMRKRGFPSPDRADAAVYSTASLNLTAEQIIANEMTGEGPLADDLMEKVM